MRIVVTAFVPFGEFTINSSYEVLNRISQKNVEKIVLPVSYPDAYLKLKESIKECDFLILLGMAAKREKVSIEVRAKNLLDFKIPDNLGNTINSQLIDENAPMFLYSKVDIDKIINHLNQDNEYVYKSNDAGSYICNYLYFKALQEIQSPCIFIHLPNYVKDKDYIRLNTLLNNLIIYIKGEEK